MSLLEQGLLQQRRTDETTVQLLQGNAVGETPEVAAEITRLAALSPLAYEQEREAAAKRLGIKRPSILDKEVEKRRLSAEAPSESIVEDITPWDEPVDGAALLDEAVATVKRHLVISDEAAHTIAAWTAGTYCYDQFSIWPKLIVRSPVKRCGKTVLLEIIDGLAHRSLLASSISPSAIFRVIDAWQPTMIIDEADTMAKDNEELRGILNAGHRKNSAHVIRNVPINKGFEPKKFSVWAPQVLAAIGDLWDTVTDRSIVVQLDRKKPGDQIVKLPLGFRQECLHLRRKSLRWAMDSQAERKRVQPSLPKHTNDRALDNWFPLFAISEVLGSHWPERIGQAFQRLEPVDETAADLKVMLLADLRDLLDGQHKTHSEEVCEHLNSLEDRPWASFRHGRGINGNALATMLKDFRKPNGSPIKAGNVRIASTVRKGYRREWFAGAFERYLPSPPPAQSATPLQASNGAASSDLQSATHSDDVALANSLKASSDAGCSGVADGKGGAVGDRASDGEKEGCCEWI